jgi:hypothetical protein
MRGRGHKFDMKFLGTRTPDVAFAAGYKRRNRMMYQSLKTLTLGLAILAAVPACTNRYDPLQRAAGGALIGAAGGAAIGAAAAGGGGAALGAAVGGVAGAITGVATTPSPPRHASARSSQYSPPSGY